MTGRSDPLVPQPRHRRRRARAADDHDRARRGRPRQQVRPAGCRASSPRRCTATWRCCRWCCWSAHVVSAVVDEYVEIRWWQAFVPFAGGYEPLWLGLGAIALDLMVVVVVTSLLRHRMRHRAWRLLHVSSYGLWVMSLLHGIGMGTDLRGGWWLVAVACAAPVPLAATYRLGLLLDRPDRTPNPSEPPVGGSDDHDVPRPAPHVRTTDGRPASPVPVPTGVTVHPGPALLAGIEHGPSLAAHRAPVRRLPRLDRDALHALVQRVSLRGRGGAAFPFATKLEASQGPPAGARGQHERGRAGQQQGRRARADPAAPRARRRGRGRPGAARARGARRAPRRAAGRGHGDADRARRAGRPGVACAPHGRAAVRRRPGQGGRRAALRSAQPAGHQLDSRRRSGHQGRPTLLSNAETWARLGLLVLRGEREYAAVGTREEPGATLLTLSRPGSVPIVPGGGVRRPAAGLPPATTGTAGPAGRRVPRLVGDLGDAGQRRGCRCTGCAAWVTRSAPASCCSPAGSAR